MLSLDAGKILSLPEIREIYSLAAIFHDIGQSAISVSLASGDLCFLNPEKRLILWITNDGNTSTVGKRENFKQFDMAACWHGAFFTTSPLEDIRSIRILEYCNKVYQSSHHKTGIPRMYVKCKLVSSFSLISNFNWFSCYMRSSVPSLILVSRILFPTK